jgi:hypothetical protein
MSPHTFTLPTIVRERQKDAIRIAELRRLTRNAQGTSRSPAQGRRSRTSPLHASAVPGGDAA